MAQNRIESDGKVQKQKHTQSGQKTTDTHTKAVKANITLLFPVGLKLLLFFSVANSAKKPFFKVSFVFVLCINIKQHKNIPFEGDQYSKKRSKLFF